MRRFFIRRLRDATGVSGVGIVCEGVLFSTGRVVLQWVTQWRSVAVYESMEDVVRIHGHGGASVVEWVDEKPAHEWCDAASDDAALALAELLDDEARGASAAADEVGGVV